MAYEKPCQTYMMELFSENSLRLKSRYFQIKASLERFDKVSNTHLRNFDSKKAKLRVKAMNRKSQVFLKVRAEFLQSFSIAIAFG